MLVVLAFTKFNCFHFLLAYSSNFFADFNTLLRSRKARTEEGRWPPLLERIAAHSLGLATRSLKGQAVL